VSPLRFYSLKKNKQILFLCKIYYFLTWLAVNKFLFRLRTRQFKYDLKLSVNRYWGSLDPASVTGIVLLKINIKKKTIEILIWHSYVVVCPSRSVSLHVYWSISAQSALTSLHECWFVLYEILD